MSVQVIGPAHDPEPLLFSEAARGVGDDGSAVVVGVPVTGAVPGLGVALDVGRGVGLLLDSVGSCAMAAASGRP